jgi:gliding motility-associated-like protein
MAQQKQGAIWRMGNWEVNFNHIPRTITQIPGYPANALADFVCCNKDGKLLCMTNRRDSLRNRFGMRMPSLLPRQPFNQTSGNHKIYVPDPGNDQQVYLIQRFIPPNVSTVDSFPLSYLKIDFRLDSGRGDATSSKFNPIDSSYPGCGPYESDFEVLKQPGSNNYVLIYFHRFKRRIAFRILSSTGIGGEILGSDSLKLIDGNIFQRNNSIKASPDGRYLAVSTFSGDFKTSVCLLKLDMANLRAERLFHIPKFPIGELGSYLNTYAFSPGSKFLYIVEKGTTFPNSIPRLGQFRIDLPDSASVVGSRVPLQAMLSENGNIEDIQIGMDGKIYYLTRDLDPNDFSKEFVKLNQINCPDVQGVGCGIQRDVHVLAYQNYQLSTQRFSIQNQAFFVNAFRFQAQAERDTICAGDSVLLSAYGAGAETFEWRVVGNANVVSTKSNYKVAPLQTTTYRVKGGSGCGQKDTIVTIHVVPRPRSPFGADTTICGNQTRRFTAVAAPHERFSWKSDFDTSANAKDSSTITLQIPKVAVPTPGFVFVRMKNPGCMVEDSLKLTILPTTNLKPSTTPKGDTAICLGQSLVARANSPLPFGVVWNTGETNTQISINQQGWYSVRIQNEFNCPSDSGVRFFLTVHPLPITKTLANGRKDSTLCYPASINLGMLPQNNVNYQWQGLAVDSLSNSQISNPIFGFQNQDTIPQTIHYQLSTIHSLTGCQNKDSLNLKLVPFLRPHAGAGKSFCNENQSSIGTKGFADFQYQWSPQNGLQNPQSAVSQTNLLNPSFENILNQAFIRTVSLLGCQASDTVQIQVFPNVPKPQLSGPQFVCPGVQNVPYQLSTLPAIQNYQLSIIHFQLSGGDSIGRFIANWNAENPIAGIKLKLGNIYGCAPDSVFLPVNITRNLKPQIPITPGQNDSLCLASAQNIKYEIAPFNPQSRYNWRFNPDNVQTQLSTFNSQLSTFTFPGIYTLTLSESDTTPLAQCFGETEFKIRIWPQPTAKQILGKDTVCENSSEEWTVESGQLNSQYNWNADFGSIENLQPNGGKVNFRADFQPAEDFTQVKITNVETSEKGCSGPENVKFATVESLPIPQIILPSDLLDWKALSNRMYAAKGRTGSYFQWTAENGIVVGGQGTNLVEVDWLADQLIYRLKVQEMTRIGCIGETEFLEIPYDSAISIPNLITPNGDEKNDLLWIKNLGFYPENELSIYDRWGKKVFESSPYQQNWPKEKIHNGLYFFSFTAGGQQWKGWLMVAE